MKPLMLSLATKHFMKLNSLTDCLLDKKGRITQVVQICVSFPFKDCRKRIRDTDF